MCSDPEMLRLLRDELREEFAARRRARPHRQTSGGGLTGLRPAALVLAVPLGFLAAMALLWL
jgi:hypothetical protein